MVLNYMNNKAIELISKLKASAKTNSQIELKIFIIQFENIFILQSKEFICFVHMSKRFENCKTVSNSKIFSDN